MVELCPLGASRRGGRAEAVFYGLGDAVIIRNIDELENKGTTGDNATASGQEVSADNIFEDRRFAGRLGADNNLFQNTVSI